MTLTTVLNRADVDRAIEIVESSRRTHVEWAEWLEGDGADEVIGAGMVEGNVGDAPPEALCCPHCDSRLYVRGKHVEYDLVCALKGRD